MMRILLHTCCAPCATVPLRALQADSHLVVAYFHNPNIHPATEFARRLGALLRLTELWDVERIIDQDYGLEAFMCGVWGTSTPHPTLDTPHPTPHTPDRCGRCYAMRLDTAAERARAEGFDAFSTTLLVSPYQKHDWIVQAGEEAADRHQVSFHYRDFRESYVETREISRAMGLYRQSYCGCVFSEEERYRGRMDTLIRRARDGG